MSLVRLVRSRSMALLLSGSAMLAGCASLPASGPTAGEIQRGTKPANNDLGFKIVDVDSATVNRLRAEYANYRSQQATIKSLAQEGHNDVVGPGDILTINLYEVGVGLFGPARVTAQAGSFDPSARVQDFPAITVDRDGVIELPYAGKLHVAGQALSEVQATIARAYKGQSQSPQVIVARKKNVAETAYVFGEVRKPGAVELTLKGERLLDAIAEAGGINTAPEDTVIRFTRNNQSIEEHFDLIRSAADDDLKLNPGDRIEVIKRPRTFLVLGATAKVSQIPFETSDVSLVEALARVGGPSDAIANPAGIFVFRFEKAADGSKAEAPVIYRVNMLRPESYFLSQHFAINDKDVIYISNAPTNALQKFVGILSQLFSPAFAAAVVFKQ